MTIVTRHWPRRCARWHPWSAVLLLQAIGEFKYREIADILQVPIGTVMSTLARSPRQHWNLYHDSEGDAELHFQISEHLAGCADCAEWFSQQSRLEALLAEKLNSQAPTPDLWYEVLTRSGLIQTAPARRWLWFAGVAACAAVLVLAVFLPWNRSPAPSSPDLAKLTAARHERLVAGDELPQFEKAPAPIPPSPRSRAWRRQTTNTCRQGPCRRWSCCTTPRRRTLHRLTRIRNSRHPCKISPHL